VLLEHQAQQERVEHQESMVLKVPLEHRERLEQVVHQEQQVLQEHQELQVLMVLKEP
jgi:hypothetical protein